jgi:hypothetical protein
MAQTFSAWLDAIPTIRQPGDPVRAEELAEQLDTLRQQGHREPPA